MRRRDFVKTCGGSLVGAQLLGASRVVGDEAEKPFSFATGAYLQNPTPTSICVQWITPTASDSWVEYGTTESLGQKAFGACDGLKSSGRVQAVSLENLEPGIEYFYRIVSRRIDRHEGYQADFGPTIRGPVVTFRTPESQPDQTKFLVFNDIHHKTGIWKTLMDRVADFPCDFALLNGDMMDWIDHEAALVESVLKPASELFAGRVPFYYARGNHDVRGPFARELKRYVTFPEKRFYFARTVGPIRLVVLDSGEDKHDSNKEYFGLADFDRYRSKQQAWLAREIESTAFKQARYRVVVHHIPPMADPVWHGPDDCFQKWVPLYKRGKVDLFIGGHTHRYQIIRPSAAENRPYAMAIGGGPKQGKAVVMKVTADQKQLRLVMIRDDGETVGSYEIS